MRSECGKIKTVSGRMGQPDGAAETAPTLWQAPQKKPSLRSAEDAEAEADEEEDDTGEIAEAEQHFAIALFGGSDGNGASAATVLFHDWLPFLNVNTLDREVCR